MKVSIITITWNSEAYLESCIKSVEMQDYPDIEYIIIDGKSSDKTMEIVGKYNHVVSHWVSEPDEGIYDAMNKGISLAKGEIIGQLNSDDMLNDPTVISRIVQKFKETQAEAVYGDLVYVAPDDLEKVVRYYPAHDFEPPKMRQGNMPPHPTFYVKRELYEELGLYDKEMEICSDFEFMVRAFLVKKISYGYIPHILVKMRTGGVSTSGIQSNLKINQEMLEALRRNNISSNYGRLYSRYFQKIFQLVNRPA
ncbi:MAG: glycosyltransferase family 2 protein [Bacteroidota bacterium]